jgi:hypothetical protein
MTQDLLEEIKRSKTGARWCHAPNSELVDSKFVDGSDPAYKFHDYGNSYSIPLGFISVGPEAVSLLCALHFAAFDDRPEVCA